MRGETQTGEEEGRKGRRKGKKREKKREIEMMGRGGGQNLHTFRDIYIYDSYICMVYVYVKGYACTEGE